jgi:hypothetical protein
VDAITRQKLKSSKAANVAKAVPVGLAVRVELIAVVNNFDGQHLEQR